MADVNFTLTIPSAWVAVTIEAFTVGDGYRDEDPIDGVDDNTGETPAAYARRILKEYVKQKVRNYKSNKDGGIASGAAAKVMRAACTLGTRPCSAMATKVELSTALVAASARRPVTSKKK